MYLILLIERMPEVWKNKNFRLFVIGTFPFMIYISLSSLWSISLVDSFRYIPKYLLSIVLSLVIILEKKISVKNSLKLLVYGTFIFLFFSTFGEIFKDELGRTGEYFEGFSGRHQSKYYAVFVFLFLFSAILTNFMKRYILYIIGIVYTIVILFLIVQRGAFLALLSGLLFIYIYVRKKSLHSIFALTLILIVFLSGIYIIFTSPSFQEYTFSSHKYTINDFQNAVLSGDIPSAINMIAFKGRLEMWEGSMEIFRNKIIGQGLATTAVEMEETVGSYLELHNDFLQYLIEGGYLGFTLYLIMWISLFHLIWKFRDTNDNYIRFISISAGSYTAALFVWSFVDHVLNYAHMNFCYLFTLIALLIKQSNENMQGKKECDQQNF